MKKLFLLSMMLGAGLVLPAQDVESNTEKPVRLEDIVDLTSGPTTGQMGRRARIAVPAGYRFTGPEGAQTMMEITGNLVSGSEIGFIMPESSTEDSSDWFIVFEFSEAGYIKDDDKDELDADKMFKQMKSNEKKVNEMKAGRGLSTLEMTGWVIPPQYNSESNNLEWASELKVMPEGQTLVNYNVRLLGRKGYVEATLVCDAAQLMELLPAARSLLAGFSFNDGEKYAEYRQGDKIAQYGLAGLVVGGAVVAAANSGLLQRLLKPLLLGLLAVGAGIKKMFSGKSRQG